MTAAAALRFGLLVLASGCCVRAAESRPPGDRCRGLAALSIPASAVGLPTAGVEIREAVPVRADAPDNLHGEYCRVTGRIRPADPAGFDINFQVNLPVLWNRKLMQFGGGGFNGVVITGLGRAVLGGEPPLKRGYATAGSDSGHPASLGPAFGLNDEALDNYSGAAVKKTRDVAVALARARYGEAPDRVYFAGGSQGGHEAMAAIQRYPRDYDGVIAAYPMYNWIGTSLAAARYARQIYKKDGRGNSPGFLSQAQGRLLNDAVIAACDEMDGVKDGIVSDPGACAFDPAALHCPEGTGAGDHCLSSAQIESVRTVAARTAFGFPLGNGVATFPGWPILEGSNWVANGLGATPADAPPNDITSARQIIRDWVVREPDVDLLRFDPAAHRKQVQSASAIVDANDADLSAYEARGGKFILVHGTVDTIVNPYASIDYYRRLVERFGRGRLDRFVKFYLVPGFGHGRPFFQQFDAAWDALGALDRWVEHRIAPANQVTEDTLHPRTRPLCEYGTYPMYSGSGDANRAASFHCAKATEPVEPPLSKGQ